MYFLHLSFVYLGCSHLHSSPNWLYNRLYELNMFDSYMVVTLFNPLHNRLYQCKHCLRQMKGHQLQCAMVDCAYSLNARLLHSFNGPLSRTTRVGRYQKGKTSLDLNEARDDGVLGCGGISWTICKQSVPHCRQITTPTPHHSMFTGQMLFLTTHQQCQSTGGDTHQKSNWNPHNLLPLTNKLQTLTKSLIDRTCRQ